MRRRCFIALLAFAGLGGCVSDSPAQVSPDAQPFVVVQPEPEPTATPDELAVGGFLFANMCAKCHGGGQGGQGGRRIGIGRSDYAGVKEIITRGTIVYGGNMPAWTGILSPDQIDDVTKYILASQRN